MARARHTLHAPPTMTNSGRSTHTTRGFIVPLVLEAVTFDHDETSARFDALSIRRSAFAPNCPPEWLRDVTRDEVTASVAAYAVNVVDSQRVTIQAALRSDIDWNTGTIDDVPPIIRVRTLDVSGVTSCLQSLFVSFGASGGPPLPPSVLGAVPETEVSLGWSGGVLQVLLPLEGTRLAEVGIGRHDVHWMWQWRPDGDSAWRTFATTRHRIYTVLDLPTAPWGQPSDLDASRSLPWADALDLACEWTSELHNIDEASATITRRLFNVGADRLRYDCDGASPHYAFGEFHFSAFLERLRGGVGNGPRVNCVDCASAVVTLSNLLGADLGAQRFGWGPSNLLSLIGASEMWDPCTTFAWHEVAWRGTNSRTDHLWDACCILDMDAAPGTPPFAGDSPVNIPHSRPWVGSYIWRATMPLEDPLFQDDFIPYDSPPARRPVY